MQAQARAWWQQGAQLAQQGQQQIALFAQLVEQLSQRDPHILVPATWGLQQAGPTAIPALLAGLTHTHPRVRRNCVDLIDHGGYGADGRCITALLPLLHNPVPHIRRAVWHTLLYERCQDTSKCEVIPTEKLDQVALLSQPGGLAIREGAKRLFYDQIVAAPGALWARIAGGAPIFRNSFKQLSDLRRQCQKVSTVQNQSH
jgi:hypothetical protein